MMTRTAEQEAVADAIAELQTIGNNYRAASQVWFQERRDIVDLVAQHADDVLWQRILDRLEKTCEIWSRWPAESQ